MQLSARILGKTTVEQLAARANAPLLQIGSDVFYRGDLAHVGCFNFIAAATLSSVVAGLQVRNTHDLFEHVPPSALVLPRIGGVALAVLGAAFEARGLGGDMPLEAWVAKHRSKEARREWVTFDTMKRQEERREAGEKKARRQRRQRTHARRNEAHRQRVQRFTTRQGGSSRHVAHERNR